MRRSEYQAVPTFDFTSAFNYKSCFDEDFTSAFNYQSNLNKDFDSHLDEDHFETATSGKSRSLGNSLQRFAYYTLTTLAFLLFLVTIPISSFFCVKKIPSLQRCLTFRLGIRLPLKGPGLILKLPFIDKISLIDLYEDRFNITQVDEEILTSDGSIITMRPCQGLLNVTNAVLTTLKIGQVDVKECLRLRFTNVLRSQHVEDLENKMEFVVKQYEENCNRFLQRWGYSLRMDELPHFTIIERADPICPIKSKLNKYLNPDDNTPSSPAEALLNLLSPMVPNLDALMENAIKPHLSATALGKVSTEEEEKPSTGFPMTDFELTRTMPVLQSFMEDYKAYLEGYSCLAIELLITDPAEAMRRHSYLQYSNGSLSSCTLVPPRVDFTVRFSSYANFEHFLMTRDLQYVHYSFH